MKRLFFGIAITVVAAMAVPTASSQAEAGAASAGIITQYKELCGDGCLSPVEAIAYADDAGTKAGISGKFLMIVQAVGETNDTVFLNSEEDYRDRNCLTIAVRKSVMDRIVKSGGFASAESAFRGKQIVISGTARKVRIDFLGNDRKRTGKYYYQIHVPVRDAKQIDVVG